MALTTDSLSQIAFKNLFGVAQTAPFANKGLFNEGEGLSLVTTSDKIIGATIDPDPAQAVTDGTVESVSVIFVEDPTSNGRAFFIEESANPGTRVRNIIGTQYGTGYFPVVNDSNGDQIFGGDQRDWIIQNEAGIFYQQDPAEGSGLPPATGTVYRYIGETVQSQIANIQAGGVTLSNGSGTTANANSVDLGGALTANAAITGTNDFSVTLNDGGTDVVALAMDASGTTASLTTTDSATVQNGFSVSLSNVSAGYQSATIFSGLTASSSEVRTRFQSGANEASIAFSAASMTVTDEINSKGLEYAADYSGNFTANSLVSKLYADSIAAGAKSKEAVRVATDAALPANTSAGSGVGATLTADADGALIIDGVTVAVNDRVLVKNEGGGTSTENGVYTVTATGDASNRWVLTRATDFDGNPFNEVANGDVVFVQEGTTCAGCSFIVVNSGSPVTVDTDTITFTTFNTPLALTGGNGIDITGSTVSVDLPLVSGLNFIGNQLRVDAGNNIEITEYGGTAVTVTGTSNQIIGTDGAGNGISVKNAIIGSGATGSATIASDNLLLPGGQNSVIIGSGGSTSVTSNYGAAIGSDGSYVLGNNSAVIGTGGVTVSGSHSVAIGVDGGGSPDFADDNTVILPLVRIGQGSLTGGTILPGSAGTENGTPLGIGSEDLLAVTTDGYVRRLAQSSIVPAAAGSDTQIQFNDNGSFGASSNFTFNNTDSAVTIGFRNGTVGENSLTIGGNSYYQNQAGPSALAVGTYSTRATGNSSLAVGVSARATYEASIALGNNSRAYAGNAMAVLEGATDSTQSFAMVGTIDGYSNGAIVFGNSSINNSTLGSGIFGGTGHTLTNGVSSVIIGGDSISSTTTATNTVFMPKVRIGLGTGASLTTDNANNNLVVRNASTGELELRDASSLAATPAGANTQIQFNNSGSFGASADFTYNPTDKTFSVGRTPTYLGSGSYRSSISSNTSTLHGDNISSIGSTVDIGSLYASGPSNTSFSVAIASNGGRIENGSNLSIIASTNANISGDSSTIIASNNVDIDGNYIVSIGVDSSGGSSALFVANNTIFMPKVRIGQGNNATLGTGTTEDVIGIDANGELITIAQSNFAASPAGATNQIQFNDGGSFGASADFTFDSTNSLFNQGLSNTLSSSYGTNKAIIASAGSTNNGAARNVIIGSNNVDLSTYYTSQFVVAASSDLTLTDPGSNAKDVFIAGSTNITFDGDPGESSVILGSRNINFTTTSRSNLPTQTAIIGSSGDVFAAYGSSIISSLASGGYTIETSGYGAAIGIEASTANVIVPANTVGLPKLRIGLGENAALATTGATAVLGIDANGEIVETSVDPAGFTLTDGNGTTANGSAVDISLAANSGLEIVSTDLQIASTLAGDNLSLTSGVLDVTASGSNNQIQFNNSGSLGASSEFTFSSTALVSTGSNTNVSGRGVTIDSSSGYKTLNLNGSLVVGSYLTNALGDTGSYTVNDSILFGVDGNASTNGGTINITRSFVGGIADANSHSVSGTQNFLFGSDYGAISGTQNFVAVVLGSYSARSGVYSATRSAVIGSDSSLISGGSVQNSAIIGSNNVTLTASNSLSLGVNNSTSTTYNVSDTVFLPNVRIGRGSNATIATGTGTDNLVVLDGVTGELKQITQSSVGFVLADGDGTTANGNAVDISLAADSGLALVSNDLTVDSAIAGNGLTWNSGVIDLGGALTSDINLTGDFDFNVSGNGERMLTSSDGTDSTLISLAVDNFSFQHSQVGGVASGFSVDAPGEVAMFLRDSINLKSLVFTESSMIVTDDINSSGLEYAADYSAQNTGVNDNPRWIPDKSYVDTEITNNAFTLTDGSGTTANGTAVDLGGTLSGATTVSTNGNTFSVGSFSSGSFDVGTSSVTMGGGILIGTITVDATTVNLTAGNSSFVVQNGQTIFTGDEITGNPAGIEYASDYSANFSARSLVDKAYVDFIAAGVDQKRAVNYASTSNVSGTYSNGASGVGATLTLSGGTFTPDGVAVVNGDEVLLKDQTDQTENGIYVVSGVGSTVVLTRRSDFDGSPSNEIDGGELVFVQSGTDCTGCSFIVLADSAVTVGTDNIVFTQYAKAGQIGAGAGLVLNGSDFDVNAVSGLNITSNEVRLGGPITVNTAIDATVAGSQDLTFGSTTNLGTVSIDATNFDVGQNTLGTIDFDFSALELTLDSAGTGMTVTDGRATPEGLVYGADYSTTFVDNSLVSKKYVDDNTTSKATQLISGTGSSQTYTITHNLNTKNVTFSVRNTSTDAFEELTVVAVTVNSIEVTGSLPSGVDNYEVTVIG